MKKYRWILLLTIVLFSSCAGSKSDCIQRLMKQEGYSYEDAKSECDDIERDSNIRASD